MVTGYILERNSWLKVWIDNHCWQWSSCFDLLTLIDSHVFLIFSFKTWHYHKELWAIIEYQQWILCYLWMEMTVSYGIHFVATRWRARRYIGLFLFGRVISHRPVHANRAYRRIGSSWIRLRSHIPTSVHNGFYPQPKVRAAVAKLFNHLNLWHLHAA